MLSRTEVMVHTNTPRGMCLEYDFLTHKIKREIITTLNVASLFHINTFILFGQESKKFRNSKNRGPEIATTDEQPCPLLHQA